MDIRNHDITNKLAQILNSVKGFDIAMSNPKRGRIIARYGGVNFLITINPIFQDNEEGRKANSEPFDKVVSDHRYVFK